MTNFIVSGGVCLIASAIYLGLLEIADAIRSHK